MGRQVIRDSRSQELGYYNTSGDVIKVYDKYSTYKGKATPQGTFDSYGKLISRNKEPGLLL